jgi:hypothetical protein
MKAGMFLLISIFLSLYGGMHFYIYKKTIAAVSCNPGLLLCVLLLLLTAPLMAELLKGVGLSGLAVPLGWVGYIWLGIAFLFVSFSGLLDLALFGLKAGGKLAGVDVASPPTLWSPCPGSDRPWIRGREAGQRGMGADPNAKAR